MTHEEREAKERRLIEINRCLGILAPQDILAPQEMSGGIMPPELDAEEMDALYEERDQLLKELDEDVE
jgi:hypothetical protein